MRGWLAIVDKKEDFGSLVSKDFKIGDIVEWSVWNSDGHKWNYLYGVVTRLVNEMKSNRLVSIATVLPLSGSRVELELFTMSLRLVSRKEDDREQ